MTARARRRWRWLAVAAAVALMGVLAYRALADPWPARLVLGAGPGEVSLAFSPSGDQFVTSGGAAIHFWDCGTGRGRATWAIPGGGVAVAGVYSSDGETFAAIVRDNNVPARLVLFAAATGRVRATTPTRHDRDAGLGYGADGSTIVVGSADGGGLREVVVCDAATGRELSATRPAPPVAGSAVGMSGDARSMAYFPQGGGPITLDWAEPGRARSPVVACPSAARATGAFDRSPDGNRCAIARLDGTIEIWDLPAGRLVATSRAHSGPNASAHLRFAPDGGTLFARGLPLNPARGVPWLRHLLDQVRTSLDLAATTEDLVVLDAATGLVLARTPDARHLHFSPDGRTVASRDDDGRIRLRELPPP